MSVAVGRVRWAWLLLVALVAFPLGGLWVVVFGRDGQASVLIGLGGL